MGGEETLVGWVLIEMQGGGEGIGLCVWGVIWDLGYEVGVWTVLTGICSCYGCSCIQRLCGCDGSGESVSPARLCDGGHIIS